MQTRAEHLEWCKQRARAYIERGDVLNGITSMLSDLDKHPETTGHKGGDICMMLMLSGGLRDPAEARRFIDGFN